ncbi:hypothetical protein GW17_00013842 [Ensete ventricosum]|nr:hypothetical protein GW17_00013842 [Ensete ventricosum]
MQLTFRQRVPGEPEILRNALERLIHNPATKDQHTSHDLKQERRKEKNHDPQHSPEMVPEHERGYGCDTNVGQRRFPGRITSQPPGNDDVIAVACASSSATCGLKEKWDPVRGEAVGRVVESGGNELMRVINSPHVRRSCTAVISSGKVRDMECILSLPSRVASTFSLLCLLPCSRSTFAAESYRTPAVVIIFFLFFPLLSPPSSSACHPHSRSHYWSLLMSMPLSPLPSPLLHHNRAFQPLAANPISAAPIASVSPPVIVG